MNTAMKHGALILFVCLGAIGRAAVAQTPTATVRFTSLKSGCTIGPWSWSSWTPCLT